MTKRFMAVLLSLALLLTCVSGLTLAVGAEGELDWSKTARIDFKNGPTPEFTHIIENSFRARGQYAIEQIPGKDYYGLKLFKGNDGVWFGADLATATEPMAVSVEYYMDSSIVNDNSRIVFWSEWGNRKAYALRRGGLVHDDVVNQTTNLTVDAPDVFTFIIDDPNEYSKLLGNEWLSFMWWGGGSSDYAYVLSVTIFPASQVAEKRSDYEYYNFDGTHDEKTYAPNPYYPDYTVSVKDHLQLVEAEGMWNVRVENLHTGPDTHYAILRILLNTPEWKIFDVDFQKAAGYSWGYSKKNIIRGDFAVVGFESAYFANELNSGASMRFALLGQDIKRIEIFRYYSREEYQAAFEEMGAVDVHDGVTVYAKDYAKLGNPDTDQHLDGFTFIGWNNRGYSIDFSVNVTEPGAYDIEFEVEGDNDNRGLELRDGNNNAYGSFTGGATGGWGVPKAGYYIKGVVLKAGYQTLRIYYSTDPVNFRWMSFTKGDFPVNIINTTNAGFQGNLGSTSVSEGMPVQKDGQYVWEVDSHAGKWIGLRDPKGVLNNATSVTYEYEIYFDCAANANSRVFLCYGVSDHWRGVHDNEYIKETVKFADYLADPTYYYDKLPDGFYTDDEKIYDEKGEVKYLLDSEGYICKKDNVSEREKFRLSGTDNGRIFDHDFNGFAAHGGWKPWNKVGDVPGNGVWGTIAIRNDDFNPERKESDCITRLGFWVESGCQVYVRSIKATDNNTGAYISVEFADVKDKTDLQAAYDTAESEIAYTSTSYAGYAEALATINTLLAKESVTEQEVANALGNLELTKYELEPVTYIYGTNLTAEGTIGVNVHVSLTEALKADAGVKFYINDEEIAPVSEAGGLYKLTSEVAAKEMGTNFTLVIKNGSGEAVAIKSKSGEAASYTYSVKSYNDAAQATSDVKLHTLMDNMLAYGAYAQNYFGYETSGLQLPDIGWTEADTTALNSEVTVRGGNDALGITYYGSSLVLKSETTLKLYFELGEDAAIDDYTFKLDETVLTPVKVGSYYMVAIENIAAKELDNRYTVKVSKGSDEYTVQTSALVYCRAALDPNVNSDENLAKLAKALYKYNQAANDFFPA